MEPHLPTQLAVVLNRGRGGAEAKCWIQQIARRGGLQRAAKGRVDNLRRQASSAGARDGRRVPQGQQAEEIPRPLFSVEKTNGQGNFFLCLCAGGEELCAQSFSQSGCFQREKLLLPAWHPYSRLPAIGLIGLHLDNSRDLLPHIQ